ncbi:MAG: Flavodoxin reductase (ferredoxin-NADPH reductase) family 1 [Acidimicrobiales bacterium]|nr:Flavodoxin reductase (ferredoxin-NADPH reductase) family 1 [Acidimicrobiales bacterium]
MKVHPQLWWFVARSSGVVAWSLCTLSVIWGLLLSTRMLGRRPPGPWLLDLHRFLGGLSVVFVVAHLTGLVADSFVQFGPAELLVPLASAWKPVPVAWGVVAMYLLVAVEVTSLLRSRMPKRLWHRVHLGSFGLYAVSTIHLLTAGTDAGGPLTDAAIASVAIVLFLSAFRVLGGRAAGIRRRAAPRPTAAAGRPLA